MAQISITNLTFSYDGNHNNVFEGFSAAFDSRWKLGLVSRNGRGKTTLLKLLTGQLTTNSGVISLPRNLTPVLFPPEVDTGTQETALSVIEGIMPGLETWKLYRELSYLDTDNALLDQSFCTLSPGEQGRILLASLFAGDDSYVLLDEPGNHLDTEGKDILTRYLTDKKSFLLVSHERALLDKVTDHTMALLKSGSEIVAGEYHVWAEHRKNIENFERAENQRLEKEISILAASGKQSKAWGEKGHRESRKADGLPKMGFKEYNRAKAAKLERRAIHAERRKEKAAQDKSKLLKDIEETAELKMSPMDFHKDIYIDAVNLHLAFEEKVLMENVTFQLRQGDRLCLAGGNGTGKSTLLKLIAGNAPQALKMCGSLHIAKGLKISVLPQKSELPDLSLMDYILQRDAEPSKVMMLLRKMDFPREVFDGVVSSYSSGQKRKLLIAMSICEEAHLYLWDEPLNYLDIQSREQVEDLILEAQPTMIFAEHDSYFRSTVSSVTLVAP